MTDASPPAAIRVADLSKRYRRTVPGDRFRTLKSALLSRNLTTGLAQRHAITALDEVSFTVPAGEAFGIVGGNGSGKSTLLKIVAGILRPTAGSVEVEGRVAALIELGAGFHPEISGRENIFINGSILGLSRRQVEERFDDIVAFAGLADFIEEPVKNYSSGMYVRLGFAVAVHTEPDVLLVDEVLSVGDESFAHRSIHRIEEMLAAGCTLLFVSHSLDLVEDVCDRVLWLEGGRPRLVGEPRRVVDAYRQAVAEEEGRGHRQGQKPAAEVERWGSGEAKIRQVRLLDGGGAATHLLTTGEAMAVEMEVWAPQPVTDFVFGIALTTPRGHEVWGTNTDLEGGRSERLAGEATVRIACPDLRLAPGEYHLDVAVHARDGSPYDYRRRALTFTVTSRERGVGTYLPRHRWSTSGGVRWQSEPRGS